MLTSDQRQQFVDDGLLVLPEVLPLAEMVSLRSRMAEIVDAFDPDEHRTVFSTTDRDQRRDQRFLESSEKISFFFEEDAVDDDGALTVPMDQAINKVGHAIHDLDPTFDRFSRQPLFAEIAADIGFVEPLLLQSMYIFKQPRIGGEVVWHTDHPFLWTDPPSVVGFWVALEDATLENGCLWALPGHHKRGPKERMRRVEHRPGEIGTRMEVLDTAPFPTDEGVALEVAAGTVVVLDGLLPHWSAPNTSDRSRHAYTLHLIDGKASYAEDNWLQRSPELPLRGF